MRTALVFLAALYITLSLPGCKTGSPAPDNPAGTVAARVLDCGTQAVKDHAIQLIGPVNSCLAQTEGWEPCLLGLVQPALGVATETLACVVKWSGSGYAADHELNGNDVVSGRAAEHARAFLRARGYAPPEPAAALPSRGSFEKAGSMRKTRPPVMAKPSRQAGYTSGFFLASGGR